MNSFTRGNEFEDEIQRKLRSHSIECYKIRLSCGDGGVDLMGNFAGYLLLIQCKNYSASTKVNVDHIYKFEGVMSKYPAKTIGIFVVPFHNNYTRRAIEEARNSRYKIILTDTLNLYDDINNLEDDNEINSEDDDIIVDDNYIKFNVYGKVSNIIIMILVLLAIIIFLK
ncbi:hypothetical protein C1645_744708 [Glomus cerebriforme]|uniref:Restriction endonuclease type IV Mrr domain-containing protein n=1 Tax=Glomus cerebriforme TaxID=658196 RepID=A0A397SFH3_9GLOM|nr:hypothetical protein C1645_744708 [Glomus cerebriforme]